MKGRYRIDNRSDAGMLFLCSFLLNLVFVTISGASEISERRVQISLSIFPRVVAVDSDFRKKLTEDRKVRLVFVYVKNQRRAKELVAITKEKTATVAGMTLDAVPASLRSLVKDTGIVPTALFVSEPLSNADFESISSYAERNGLILFSPFTGDVERGATAGIAVSSRVRPYFNIGMLQRSGININAMLMNISKHYE